MPINAWLQPPRHLVVLFLGITVVLIAALVWLGGRLLQQDRALERQRVQDRLERAADRVAAELTNQLANAEDTLTQLAATDPSELAMAIDGYAGDLTDDAVMVVINADRLESFPAGRLLYYPGAVAIASAEPPPSRFAAGEAAEFRARDFERAGRLFQSQAQSDDPATRAGALLRLARVRRKANRPDEALDIYVDLAALGDTPVNGLPAELVARAARITVLGELSRVDALRPEAESLYADLHRGRWRMTRATYQFYEQELRAWVVPGTNEMRPVTAVALATGVERLWEEWQGAPGGADRRVMWVDEEPVLLVWVSGPESTTGLIAGSGQLGAWLAGVQRMLDAEGVTVSLTDAGGKPIVSQFAEQPEVQATRTAPESGLPLTLHVASVSLDADFAQFAERRRLLLLGTGVVALLVFLGLYAVVRGVTRELEAARLQSDFVSAVSHEFRTPLTSLRQLTELLASGRVASDQRRALYYDVIKRESERLHRLVEGLLDFGRMEAGALEFHPEDVDSGTLIREVVDEFRQEVGAHGYEIVLNGGGEPCTLRVDEEAMKRALWNLLDNAMKYSPDCRTIWVNEVREDRYFAVRVRDRGVGIAPSDQRAIFDKFFRADTSDQINVGGTGIGLAMVHHIVEAHGGEVRVESEPGVGSTFSLLLPIRSD